MLKYIIPRISRDDLAPMITVSLIGAVIAAVYGILHDQISFTISPEYYTKFKFNQFHYANFGFHDRIYVAEIGALATWWVGFFCVWFLSRRLIPNRPRAKAYRQITLGFTIVGVFAIAAGIVGYAYGLLVDLPISNAQWARAVRSLNIEQPGDFIRVAYIHNASYLGGIIGLLVAMLAVRPSVQQKDGAQTP